MINKQYSRLQKVEENKNIRTAIIFGGLTVAFILFALIFGVSLATRITGYVSDIKSGKQKPTTDQSISLVLPPTLSAPPEFTSKASIDIKGTAQPNQDVVINLNNSLQTTTSDDSGNFISTINLQKGSNTLFAVAKDSKGNTSDQSQKYTIVFDNEPPKLKINSPTDGSGFFGDKQKQLSIQGTTDPEAQVTVNDRTAIVDNGGNFTLLYSLSNGSNSFDVISLDRAGNKTEVKFSVNFTP